MKVFIPDLMSWYVCGRGPQPDHSQKTVSGSQLICERKVTCAPSSIENRAALAGQRPRV